MEKGLTEVCALGNVCTAATDTESHSFDTKSTIESGTKQDGNFPVNGVFAKWNRKTFWRECTIFKNGTGILSEFRMCPNKTILSCGTKLDGNSPVNGIFAKCTLPPKSLPDILESWSVFNKTMKYIRINL